MILIQFSTNIGVGVKSTKTGYHSRNNSIILYLQKSHNTPLLPPKICIGIFLDYSWDMFMSQEKLQTMSMQKFWGVKEVHYGIVQVVSKSHICVITLLHSASYPAR